MFIKLSCFPAERIKIRINSDKIVSYNSVKDQFGEYTFIRLESGYNETVKETVEEIDVKLGSLMER